MLSRVCAYALIVLLFSLPISSQITPDSGQLTLHSKSRLVVFDVVVTDRYGNHIKNLTSDKFRVFENKKPQTISSFENHNDATIPETHSVATPPSFYTNLPSEKSSATANVLILDALNTPLSDQSNVRVEMINYLKKIPPGTKFAVVTLSPNLRLVQGFTTNTTALLQAINSIKLGAGPHASPLLKTKSESQTEKQFISDMAQTPGSQGVAEALQSFLSESEHAEDYSRITMTLQAFQELARFLDGMPGRKNLIWFASSFPNAVFAANKTQEISDNLQASIHSTMNMLVDAQIAIYPISAEALAPDSFTEGSAGSRQFTGAAMATQGLNQQLLIDSQERAVNQSSMDEIAKETGGKAFYNTNSLNDALAQAVADGAQYYTISYVPLENGDDKSYKSITVKVAGHYKLAYRRGYFSDDSHHKNNKEQPTSDDPLVGLMAYGMPDSTQLIYKISVAAAPALKTKATAGDNHEIIGPTRRYTVDFNIDSKNIEFKADDNGLHNGKLEVSIVAFDQMGTPKNWFMRELNLSVRPETYELIQKRGLSLSYPIDVPQNGIYLRTGVFDQSTGNVGTIQLPLSDIAIPSAVSEAPLLESASTLTEKPLSDTKNNEQISTRSNSGTESSASIGTLPSNDHSASTIEKPAPLPSAQTPNSKSQIASYCFNLGNTNGHSSALSDICNFALSMQANMPDLICKRRVRRSWLVARGYNSSPEMQTDTVAATVTYRNGHDYYTNVEVDGKVTDTSFLESSGVWSDGEFANILAGIFAPSSKTSFRSKKDESVHSKSALVFEFTVLSADNQSYYIEANHQIWYPGYHGRIWIDKATSQILRIERETEDMSHRPLYKVKTTIDYNQAILGDGSQLALPASSNVSICTRWEGCSRITSQFIDWQKFEASTKIILNSQN